MFWTDIARFLQDFRNLSNSFINIFAILQDFNGIFSKYSFTITVLRGYISVVLIVSYVLLVVVSLKCPYFFFRVRFYSKFLYSLFILVTSAHCYSTLITFQYHVSLCDNLGILTTFLVQTYHIYHVANKCACFLI